MTDAHVKGLEDEVSDLKKKNQNIQKELKEVKNLYEDADFELKNAQRKLEEEKRTKNRLEEEQRELEKERDALKRKLDAERKKQGVGASDELQDRLNELEEKLQEQKESRKDEKKKFEDTRAKMHKEVIELVESKRVLKDDLESIKGKLENQKKDYEKRIAELKTRQEEYEQNQQKMAEERQKVSQQGSSSALLNQKTEEELRALRSKLDNKHKKNKDLKEEKEQLEEELDSMKKKYKRQTMAMQEFDEAKEKFEKSLAELRSKLKEETAHNSELSEQTENLSRDNEALKQKLEKIEKEKAKLKDEKDKRRQNDRDSEKEVDVLKDKLQEKEVELTKLSEIKRNIEKELDSLKGQKARSGTVDSSSVAALEAKIAELKNLLEQEKAKNASLNDSIVLKTQELAAKNKEIEALKDKLAETKQKKKDVKAKLGAEVRQLKMQVTELETVAAASDEKSRKLQSELDSKLFVSVKQDNSRELTDELERVKKQLLTKKNKKKALKKSYDNLDEKYKALQAQADENEKLKKEVERLEKLMGELEEHNKHELQVTKKRVHDLEAQNKVMSTAAIEARQYVEQAQKDTDSLVSQLQEKLKESLEREHQYKQLQGKQVVERELKLQAESGNVSVQLVEAEAQMTTLKRKYNEIKAELEKGHAENVKLQAANAKLQEENKQLTTEIAKYKKLSDLEAREFGLSAKLDDIMRRRLLPEYVSKSEEEVAQAHKSATILQVKLEKILERETETRKIRRVQESKIKRNIHWLRTERRNVKNHRNKLAEASNELARVWERLNKIENDLSNGKKKFQHHLDGSEPLPEDSLILVLKFLKEKLKDHSEIEKLSISAKEKRDMALSELKNLVFVLERAIVADDFGLADPEEAQLKKELETERAIRRRYEEKHDQAVIKAREAGSRLVDVITTYSDQLFPSAPDPSDLPQIVTRTIDFLEQKAMAVEDIFGKTEYQVDKVKQIKKYFDEGYDVDLSKCGDFKIVGELLKAYFRELPESLIPIEISDKFTTVLKETPDKVNKIEELIESLPKANRKVLAALAIFLHKLSKKSDINKMTSTTLGEIFGPYLLRPTRGGSNLVQNV